MLVLVFKDRGLCFQVGLSFIEVLGLSFIAKKVTYKHKKINPVHS
jgi:hypothetical protein